jgi:hypothetical protein
MRFRREPVLLSPDFLREGEPSPPGLRSGSAVSIREEGLNVWQAYDVPVPAIRAESRALVNGNQGALGRCRDG